MPHNIYHLDPNSALGKAMTDENLDKLKHSKQKYIDRHIEKGPENEITVIHQRSSPIQSATGIEGNLLWEDKRYELRNEYLFEGDKKNNRTASGTIISRENIDKWELDLEAARYVFDKEAWEKHTDVEITELKDDSEIQYSNPIIDQDEFRNVGFYRAKVGESNATGAEKFAAKVNEDFVLSIAANRTAVLVVNAYNYEDKKGKKNRDNIQYIWRFSTYYDTGPQHIDRVIGTDRKLLLENIQRHHTGWYTCDITNDKGVTQTATKMVLCWRTGTTKEITIKQGNEKIGTGRFEFIPDSGILWWTKKTNNPQTYNERYKKTDSHWDYDLSTERWVFMTWRGGEQWATATSLAVSFGKPWIYNEKIKWIKDNSMKGNQFGVTNYRKQGYWKYENNLAIFWSDPVGVVKFKTESSYFTHRKEMSYPRDWSLITILKPADQNPFLAIGEEII